MRFFILLFIIFIGCSKDVEVENPINAQNVQKIAQLQEQLNAITSSLQASLVQNESILSENEELQNQIESIQAQLVSVQAQLVSTEGELESSEGQIAALLEQITVLQSNLNVFLLAEAIQLGVQDGTYIEVKRKNWSDGDEIPDWTYLTSNEGENGLYVKVANDTISKNSGGGAFQINDLGEYLLLPRWTTPPIENSEIYPFVSSTVTITGINEVQFTSRGAFTNNPVRFRTRLNVYQKVPNEDLPLDWIYTNREVGDSLRAVANFNFYKDSIYSKIDPYNYESIKEAFILDAKRNGLDISYIRNETLIIDVVDWNYGQAYAATCQTGKIKLSWEDNYDVLHDPQGQERYLKTMWHELGHGVLNLKHNSINTDIMYSSPRGNGSIIYDLDEFRESSRRMFQNIGQIPYDCGFAVSSTIHFTKITSY
tara:strand:- start:682 stop:1959 length:1278 start_codon:yes stop_codon:yes gene_type:complete